MNNYTYCFDDIPGISYKSSEALMEMVKSNDGHTFCPSISYQNLAPSVPQYPAELMTPFIQLIPFYVLLPFCRVLVPSPKNQEEVQARAAIRRKCLQHFLKFRKSAFPGQKVKSLSETSFVQYGSIKISLKGFWHMGLYIPPGGGIDTRTGLFALDPIELLSMVRNCSYNRALELLTFFYKPDVSITNTATDEKESGEWINVTKRFVKAPFLPLWYLPAETLYHFVYTNEIDEPIAIVSHIMHLNGIKTYHLNTLWKHTRTSSEHWFEFAQDVFPLFNQNNIYKNPEAVVVVVKNEYEVLSSQKNADPSKLVFTTCPNGIINFLKTNLVLLKNRNIIINLNKDNREAQEAYRIINSEKAKSFNSLRLSFDNCQTFITSKDFMRDPSVFGCDYAPQEIEHLNSPITNAGERIPGSNIIRNMILKPIIKEGYLCFLFSDAKLGKTHVAIDIAYAVAKGCTKVAKWSTSEKNEVLYVDGEMFPDELESTIKMIMKGHGDISEGIPFKVYCAKSQPEGIIDLLSEKCQKNIEDASENIKFIVFDNLNCLIPEQTKSIKSALKWINKLCNKGIAVLIVDHTNKLGDIQGSSFKEKVTNLGIKLERHPDNDKLLIVSYPFTRRLFGSDAEDFIIRKVSTEDSFSFELESDDKTETHEEGLQNHDQIKLYAMASFYKNIKKNSLILVGKQLNISKSTVGNILNKYIPSLKGEDKLRFDKEYNMLIAEYSIITAESDENVINPNS